MSTDNFGNVIQVLGPVVDVEFGGELPPINSALRVSNHLINDQEWNLVVEVAQQIGSKRVRCIARIQLMASKEVPRFLILVILSVFL